MINAYRNHHHYPIMLTPHSMASTNINHCKRGISTLTSGICDNRHWPGQNPMRTPCCSWLRLNLCCVKLRLRLILVFKKPILSIIISVKTNIIFFMKKVQFYQRVGSSHRFPRVNSWRRTCNLWNPQPALCGFPNASWQRWFSLFFCTLFSIEGGWNSKRF